MTAATPAVASAATATPANTLVVALAITLLSTLTEARHLAASCYRGCPGSNRGIRPERGGYLLALARAIGVDRWRVRMVLEAVGLLLVARRQAGTFSTRDDPTAWYGRGVARRSGIRLLASIQRSATSIAGVPDTTSKTARYLCSTTFSSRGMSGSVTDQMKPPCRTSSGAGQGKHDRAWVQMTGDGLASLEG